MSISLRDSDICNQTDVVNIILFTHTADKHRVPLRGEHPDYVNAVFINVSFNYK